MKKISLFLLILVLFSTLAVNAAEIKDVPENHWAYNSVKTLVDKGYLSLYEDGTFRGQEKVSRYQLAEIVARILTNLQGGSVTSSSEDLELIRQLSVEFREELVDLAVQGDIFQEEIEKIQQKNIIQDESLAQNWDQLSALQLEVTENKNNLQNIEQDLSQVIENILKIEELENKIAELETAVNISSEDYTEKLNAWQEELTATQKLLEQTREELANQKLEISNEFLQDLEDRQIITQTRVHNLQTEVNTLKEQLSSRENELQALKEENQKLQNNFYLVGAAAILSLLLSF